MERAEVRTQQDKDMSLSEESLESDSQTSNVWVDRLKKYTSWSTIALGAGLLVSHFAESQLNSRGEVTSVTAPSNKVECLFHYSSFESMFAEVFPVCLENSLRRLAQIDARAHGMHESGLSLVVCEPHEWSSIENVPCIIDDNNTVKVNGTLFYDVLSSSSYRELSEQDKSEYLVVKLLPAILAAKLQKEMQQDLAQQELSANLVFTSDLFGCVASYESSLRTYLTYDVSLNAAENLVCSGSRHASYHYLTAEIDKVDHCLGPLEASKWLARNWSLPTIEQAESGPLSLEQVVSLRYAAKLHDPHVELSREPLVWREEGNAMLERYRDEAQVLSERVQRHTLGQSLENVIALRAKGDLLQDTSFAHDSRGGKAHSLVILRELTAATSSIRFNGNDPLFIQLEELVQGLLKEYVEHNGPNKMLWNYDLEFTTGLLKLIKSFPEDNLTRQDVSDTITADLRACIDIVCKAPEEVSELHSFSFHTVMLSSAYESVLQLGENGSLNHDEQKELLERIESAGDRVEFTAFVPSLTVRDQIIPLLSNLDHHERSWAEQALLKGGVNVDDNVFYGFAGRGSASSLNVEVLGERSSFCDLSSDAQAALLKSYSTIAPGHPRQTVLDIGVGHYCSSEEMSENIGLFATAVCDLPDREQLLLCEAYAMLPTSMKKIDGEYSPSGKRLPWLRNLLGDELTDGPLSIAVDELIGRDSRFADIDSVKLLTEVWPAKLPYFAWSANVSVLTSSTAQEVSWSAFYDYQTELSRGLSDEESSIFEAQATAFEYCKGQGVRVSSTFNWLQGSMEKLINGSTETTLSPGIYNQHPQTHRGLIVPSAGPEVGLILYGDKSESELSGDRFKRSANDWIETLKKLYDCSVSKARPESHAQLARVVSGLKFKASKDKDLLIVIVGHGSSGKQSATSYSPLVNKGGGRDLGTVSLGGGFKIDEITLKTIVNSELAPAYRSVTIIVDSCHSGAWVQ